MMPRLFKAFFVCATVSMGIVGPFTHRLHTLSLVLTFAGFAGFIIAVLSSGVSQLRSVFWLLVSSNLSFWMSVALWHVGRRTVFRETEAGIDAFAGIVAIWFFVSLLFLIYELTICILHLFRNRERRLALAGIVVSLLQIPTALNFMWQLTAGV